MVKIDIEGCQIDFIMDTGAAILTMTTTTSWLTKDTITIIGATGNTNYWFYEPQECMVGGHQVRHQFLYVAEAPGHLLGRDLLSKLGTTVSMDLRSPRVSTLPVLTMEVSLEEE
jgi:predicted aspartyl protease